MTRLYVTAPDGRRIPGYGSREYGEYFDDLPDDIVQELSTRTGFSLTDPAAVEPPDRSEKPANRRKHEEG
jgi:hypothetical protein